MDELRIKCIEAEIDTLESAKRLLKKLAKNGQSGIRSRVINKKLKKLDKRISRLDSERNVMLELIKLESDEVRKAILNHDDLDY